MLKKFCVSLLLIGATISSGLAENLLKNPGFEKGTPRPGMSRFLMGWDIRSMADVIRFHDLDVKNPYEGKRAARICIPAEKSNAVGYFSPSEMIPVKSGKNYRLTFSARFPDAPTGSKAEARLSRFDAERKFIGMGGIKAIAVQPSTEWRSYSLDYLLPPGQADSFLSLQLLLSGSGEVFYDQISLEEVESPKLALEFYPSSVNTEKTLYPIVGELCHLLIYPFTSGSREKMTLVLDAPVEFPLVQALPAYGFNVKEIEPFTREKIEGGIRYRIPLPPQIVLPISRLASDLFTGEGLLFRAESKPKNSVLKWALEQNGERLESGIIELRPLVVEASPLPREFSLFTWYAPFLNVLTDPVVLQEWLKQLKRSGITGGSIGGPRNVAVFNAEKFRNIRSFWYLVPEHCLTKFLENRKFIDFLERMRNGISGFDSPTVNWNFEPGLKDYYHLCPDCCRAFERFSGHSIAGMIDGREVEKMYPEQYLAFRTGQYEQIVKNYSEWCRNAGARAALCSYTVAAEQTAERRENLQRRLGNLPAYAKLLDCYMPQVYSPPERHWDQQEAMLKFYPGTVVPVYTSDERHNRNTYSYSLLTPEALRLEVLMAAAQGCRKVGFFVGSHTFDGRQIQALRQALADIAVFEDYWFHGDDSNAVTAALSHPMIRFNVKKYQGKYLLTVFNPDSMRSHHISLKLMPELKEFMITVPREQRVLQQPDGRRIFRTGEILALALPPSTVRFFLISVPEPAFSGQPEILKPIAELQKRKFSLLNQDGWECEGIGLSSESPERIVIRRNDRQIVVNVADGAVIGSIEPQNLVFYEKEGRGGFFRDLFWQPEQVRWGLDCRMPYRLRFVRLESGKLWLELDHEMQQNPVKGLLLQKTYMFSSDFRQLDARIRISNPTGHLIDFAYWAHNRTTIAKPRAVYEIPGLKTIVAAETAEENIFLPASDSRQVILSKQLEFSWDGAGLDYFYFWLGDMSPSVELIGVPIKLAPGQNWGVTICCRLI